MLFELIDGVRAEQEILEKMAEFIDAKTNLARVLLYEMIVRDKFLDKPSHIVVKINERKEDLVKMLLENDKSFQKGETVSGVVRLPRYGRVNTLKTNIEDVIAELQEDLELVSIAPNNSHKTYTKTLAELKKHQFVQDPHVPNVLAFHPNVKFYSHPLYVKGHVLLQDKMSCLPPILLDPEPGSVILDACAAPGMKTSHLAALINNNGTILANDISEDRLHKTVAILRDCNVTCVKTTCRDFTEIDPQSGIYPQVKYILADVPCTGSGIATRVDVYDTTPEELYQRLLAISTVQKKILKHCFSFPNVYRVVYSTCSIHKEENEDVVREVMDEFAGKFRVVKSKYAELFPRKQDTDSEGQFVGTYPERDSCNGFFVAVLEKVENEPIILKRKKNSSKDRVVKKKKKSKSDD